MACTCNNIIDLGNVGACKSDYLKTTILAESEGIYSLFIEYLGEILRIDTKIAAGEEIQFPTYGLNEFFTFATCYITGPDGERLIMEREGYGPYDCLRFQTMPRMVVSTSIDENVPGTSPAGEHREFLAGENISGNTIVVELDGSIYAFDPDNADHFMKVVGLLPDAVLIDEIATVIISGLYTSGSFTGIVNDIPVFADGVGTISNTPGTTLIIQEVGVGIDSDTIFVNIGTPFYN